MPGATGRLEMRIDSALSLRHWSESKLQSRHGSDLMTEPRAAESASGDRSTRDEIIAELNQLFSGNVNIADGIVPPLVFIIANSVAGLLPAAGLGLASAIGIVLWRLARGRPLRFALAGLGGTVIAVVFALRSDQASGYFLPGIISGGVTTLAILASIVAKKPFVAWTSWLMRGWPIDWYWHPRVRPAYSKASWLWAGFFGIRTITQWWLFQTDQTAALGVTRVITGWPALLVLLIATYVLGRKWLSELDGPSVDEFENEADPPWQGQPAGF